MEPFINKLIAAHFENQMTLYLSEMVDNEKYTIYFSKLIDDCYWNIANIKNIKDIEEFEFIKNNIIEEFVKKHRNPVIYITPLSPLYKEKGEMTFEKIYTDSWLYLDNLSTYPNYKSKVNIEIKKVNELIKEDFINSVSEGFSSDNPAEPYIGLTDEYKTTIRNTFDDKNIIHYIATFDNKIVGTVTAIIKNKIACIYNVTTAKHLKKNGICKELISYVIHELYKLDINEVCLQTESGFYTEQIYLNLGFKKIFEGFAYKL